MRNPLNRRILRELKADWKKYSLTGLFLVLTIGFVSGIYIANDSMMAAIEEGNRTRALEWGRFTLKEEAGQDLLEAVRTGAAADLEAWEEKQLDDSQDLQALEGTPYYQSARQAARKQLDETREKLEAEYELADIGTHPVQLVPLFSKDVTEKGSGTIRVFENRTDMDRPDVLEGRLAETADEIAIDRMHADNAGLSVGDTLTAGGQDFVITGLVALPDYVTLHEKNTDFMFDALKFDVGLVTDAGFERLTGPVNYCYGWSWRQPPADEAEEKAMADDFVKALGTQVLTAGNSLQEYIPRYANNAVNFATDDMGSDKAMAGVLLDILVVIIAFLFAVMARATIMKESRTIGTLLASGMSKRQLILHYLAAPAIVTLAASAAGNLLGYTLFWRIVQAMYYNSYSLPVSPIRWNPEAFWKTTLIPVILMLAVNLAVLTAAFCHTPQEFLRKDLKSRRHKSGLRLEKGSIMHRWRLRILTENLAGFGVMLAGICFVSLLLTLAIGMPASLDYYQDRAPELVLADYQYLMTQKPASVPEGAEPFRRISMVLPRQSGQEDVSVYGIEEDSDFVRTGEGTWISQPLAEKFGLAAGSELVLKDPYDAGTQTFEVSGVLDKAASMDVYLPASEFADRFGDTEDALWGLFSDRQLAQADAVTVITQEDLTKMADQLDHSMGDYMKYFQVLCVLLAGVLIFLLTRFVLERSESQIALAVAVSALAGAWFGQAAMDYVWQAMMQDMTGWFTFQTGTSTLLQVAGWVLAAGLIALLLEYRRIRRISKTRALKEAD